MTDCYFPPSHNYLAPVPTPGKNQIAPESILDNLTAFAGCALAAMKRGEVEWNDIIRTHGAFLIDRRWVRVGLTFLIINGVLAEPGSRSETLRSIGRQINAVCN